MVHLSGRKVWYRPTFTGQVIQLYELYYYSNGTKTLSASTVRLELYQNDVLKHVIAETAPATYTGSFFFLRSYYLIWILAGNG